MARPTSITSRSFANRAAPRCRRRSGPIADVPRRLGSEFIGPCDPIRAADSAWGIDLEAEVAVVTDVPQGATPATAPLIRLFMLVNDISLRNLIPGELAKGFGFRRAKDRRRSRRSPDELGAADSKKVHLPLLSQINGKPFGRPNAGVV